LAVKSGLFWLSMDKCYQVNTERPAYGNLDHSPVHFRDWHMV